MMMVDGDNNFMMMIGCPRTPSPFLQKIICLSKLKNLNICETAMNEPKLPLTDKLLMLMHSQCLSHYHSID
jgi:hypothetical protein